jgi:biotin synthase-like enzyme
MQSIHNRIRTIIMLENVGMNISSDGILGMGETNNNRV